MNFTNDHTKKSIDMEYILANISPVTPYGLQRKKEIKPYNIEQKELLQQELNITEKFINQIQLYPKVFHDINSVFNEIKEIRGSLTRVANGSILDEVELFELKSFILCIKDLTLIQNTLNGFPDTLKLNRKKELEVLFDPENRQEKTFYIYDSYSEKLKSVREERRAQQRLLEAERKSLIISIEEQVGARLKLSGEVTVMKQDSDRMDKARQCSDLVEGASTVLMTTFKMKNSELLDELEKKVDDLKYEEDTEEFNVRASLSKKILENVKEFYNFLDTIAKLDFLIAKANFAIKFRCVKPIIQDDLSIVIKNGRHIKLEDVLHKQGRSFTPVSFSVYRGATIITGANMGGKTVNLKIAGMLTSMTQYGIFVPAEEFRTCLFDYIYFSIGDMQSIDSGLSTFGSEIYGMKEILQNSKLMGLILIDELARGTNPEEGYAISRAIVRYLKDISSITLFTTHFDGIAKEDGIRHLQVKGLKNVDFNELMNKLSGNNLGMSTVLDYMDYTLEEVNTNYSVPRDAINIAKLMGLDDIIINWSEEILKEGREDKNE